MIMTELALHYNKRLISSSEIAERQDLSLKYLESIIKILSRTGLTKSIRGAMGGHSLIKAPKDYTVGEVLRALEGSLSVVDCLNDDYACDRKSKCVTIVVWEKMNNAISDVVDNITLQDLVDDYHSKCGLNYTI